MGFNRDEFSLMLEKAKGKERSINKYGDDCGISPTHISRLIRGIVDTAPSPDTLQKFASAAYNGVSYNDLMKAAGHIDSGVFFSENMNLIKGDLSWNELSKSIIEKYDNPVFESKFGPKQLEKIAKGELTLDDYILIDLLAMYSGVDHDVLCRPNTTEEFLKAKQDYKNKNNLVDRNTSHYDQELIDFINDKSNLKYIIFSKKLKDKGIDPDDIISYNLKA